MGLNRASIISDPEHPQCLNSVFAPIPYISWEGLDLVNVAQRKLLKSAAKNLGSSQTTTNGYKSESKLTPNFSIILSISIGAFL